jgi:hypothetical protein
MEPMPAELLELRETGEVPLMWPTLVTLQALERCRSAADVLRLRVEQVPSPRAPR